MDQKRSVAAVLAGTVVLWATGWLIFQKLFAGFYEANRGSATGVSRDADILWAVILASVPYALLILYAMRSRAATPLTVGRGAWIGAVVGFLLWAHVDLLFYGALNLSNLTVTMVDPLLEFVHGGIGGATIAAVLGAGGGKPGV